MAGSPPTLELLLAAVAAAPPPLASPASPAVPSLPPLVTSGDQPTERYGHTAVLIRGCLYVFGGSANQTFSDELYSLNLETGAWALLKPSGKAPKGRHFHSAVAHNGHMWIWGGKSNGYMNDLAHYDPVQNAWIECVAEGQAPSRRYGHSAVAYGDHMYVYGGYDDYGFPCNDVHAFSFERIRWRPLKSLGPSPDRFHHSAVLWQGSMYTFGGYGGFADVFEYRLSSSTWTAIQTHGARPEPRWGHRAVEHMGAMYVVGGCDSVLSYSDVWRLDLERRTWSRLPPAVGHAQRFFHSTCVYKERLYTFGGKNMHNFAFNDVLQQDVHSGVARFAERPDTMLADLEGLYAAAADSGDVRIEWGTASHDPAPPPAMHAHSLVLLARSPRLLRWLQQRASLASDGRTGLVRLKSKHGPPAAWSILIRYLYTSFVLFPSLPSPASPPHSPLSPHHGGALTFAPLSADAELALDVLRLAHKFELDHLKAAYVSGVCVCAFVSPT